MRAILAAEGHGAHHQRSAALPQGGSLASWHLPGRRLHRPTLRRQPGRRLRAAASARRRLDAERRARDEPLRDGVPAGRRTTASTCAGSRPTVEVDALRPRDAGQRARAVGERASCAADEQARFHTQSGLLTADARGRLDRAGLPGRARRSRAEPPAGLARGARRRAAVYVGRTGSTTWSRSAIEARRTRARARHRARCATLPARAASSSPPRGQRPSTTSSRASSPPAPASTRTRSPARRTAAWPRTGPSAWARREMRGLPGLGARRRRARRLARRARAARRPGRHRDAGGAAGVGEPHPPPASAVRRASASAARPTPSPKGRGRARTRSATPSLAAPPRPVGEGAGGG